ncbi:MAG: LPS export ABC transporter periplasmic protein LptC [Marinosulfonomonas sp.]|nr:LPS export ABC transporter periplasmic protein LptC [Marinosulfonomonas sp.]
MFTQLRVIFITIALVAMPVMATAQGTQIAFGGLKHDSTQPVEMSSDQLQINQADGSAVFSGNVVIGQGTMRLSAARVVVEYAKNGGGQRISKLHASGGVVLVNGGEAAEAREAIYSIDNGTIVMSGDVILTQGQSALSSNRMVVDLKTGQATLEGRVKTILQTGGN